MEHGFEIFLLNGEIGTGNIQKFHAIETMVTLNLGSVKNPRICASCIAEI